MRSEKSIIFYSSIIENMKEGVLTLDLNGTITSFNPAAEKIMNISASDILGEKYAGIFFEHEENDHFNQTILDAIYEASTIHNETVVYYNGNTYKNLFMTTSLLDNEISGRIGVMAVFNDISELTELRDAVKAMEKIKALNTELSHLNSFIKKAFGRYVPEEVVHNLIENPDNLNLGGQIRNVTIMMTDLRGFTAMSSRLTPEEIITILNNYYQVMVNIISQHQGTVLEYIGDSVMAVFGAPADMEKHPENAVACALTMQKAMQDVNRWNNEHEYPPLSMGIGLNSGDVVAGNVGSEKITKYSILGSEVNMASRIESLTVGGQILIGSQTLDRITCPLTVGKEFSAHVKGFDSKIDVFEILGIGSPYEIFLTQVDSSEYQNLLKKPINCSINEMHEKKCSEEKLACIVTELTPSGMYIKISRQLELFRDIKISIECSENQTIDDIYGKIIDIYPNKETHKVSFTSLPDSFKDFLDKLCLI